LPAGLGVPSFLLLPPPLDPLSLTFFERRAHTSVVAARVLDPQVSFRHSLLANQFVSWMSSSAPVGEKPRGRRRNRHKFSLPHSRAPPTPLPSSQPSAFNPKVLHLPFTISRILAVLSIMADWGLDWGAHIWCSDGSWKRRCVVVSFFQKLRCVWPIWSKRGEMLVEMVLKSRCALKCLYGPCPNFP
jgi:hypothetical protein